MCVFIADSSQHLQARPSPRVIDGPYQRLDNMTELARDMITMMIDKAGTALRCGRHRAWWFLCVDVASLCTAVRQMVWQKRGKYTSDFEQLARTALGVRDDTPISAVSFGGSYAGILGNKPLMAVLVSMMAHELVHDNPNECWRRPFSDVDDCHGVDVIGLIGGAEDCVCVTTSNKALVNSVPLGATGKDDNSGSDRGLPAACAETRPGREHDPARMCGRSLRWPTQWAPP